MKSKRNLIRIFPGALSVFALLAAMAAGPRWGGSELARADDDVATLKAGQDAPERRKQLHFEDDLIEGINHNPFDSLEHIANQDLRDNSHLYKKKPNFRVEMKQQVRDEGYTQ